MSKDMVRGSGNVLSSDGYVTTVDNHQQRLRHQAMFFAVDMYKAISSTVSSSDGSDGELVVGWAKEIEAYLDVKESK